MYTQSKCTIDSHSKSDTTSKQCKTNTNIQWYLVWQSKYLAIVEHSMCHPGLPCPQGDSQWGSCGLDAFHRAKSLGSLLSWAPKIQETVNYSTLFRLASNTF